jgi:hypothetical protein
LALDDVAMIDPVEVTIPDDELLGVTGVGGKGVVGTVGVGWVEPGV